MAEGTDAEAFVLNTYPTLSEQDRRKLIREGERFERTVKIAVRQMAYHLDHAIRRITTDQIQRTTIRKLLAPALRVAVLERFQLISDLQEQIHSPEETRRALESLAKMHASRFAEALVSAEAWVQRHEELSARAGH